MDADGVGKRVLHRFDRQAEELAEHDLEDVSTLREAIGRMPDDQDRGQAALASTSSWARHRPAGPTLVDHAAGQCPICQESVRGGCPMLDLIAIALPIPRVPRTCLPDRLGHPCAGDAGRQV